MDMFTGLVSHMGTLLERPSVGGNCRLIIASELGDDLRIGESVAHQGVCLSIDAIAAQQHEVVTTPQTLRTTTLGELPLGARLNLERALVVGKRLEGHLVQGHVDGVLRCCAAEKHAGSYSLGFELPARWAKYVIEKGSICLDGVSLTAHDVSASSFYVSLIPQTKEQTSLSTCQVGKRVNVEFDVLGKYVAQQQKTRKAA